MFYLDVKFLLKDNAVTFKDPSIQPKKLTMQVYNEPKKLNPVPFIMIGTAVLIAIIVLMFVYRAIKKKKSNG